MILIQINLNYGNNGTRQQMSFVIITMKRTEYLKECKEVVQEKIKGERRARSNNGKHFENKYDKIG